MSQAQLRVLVEDEKRLCQKVAEEDEGASLLLRDYFQQGRRGPFDDAFVDAECEKNIVVEAAEDLGLLHLLKHIPTESP